MRAYALAVATFGAALAITRLTWPFLSHTPFILFFAAVFATANWGSEGAGVVTIVLTALASSYIAPPSQASAISDISLWVFLVGAVIGNRIVRSRATL